MVALASRRTGGDHRRAERSRAARIVRVRDGSSGAVSPRRRRARERAHCECVSERAQPTTPGWPVTRVVGVSEAICKPSSVPPRLTARRGWPSIWGRRSPDGSCGRPEGWAAHLSPVDGHPSSGYALLFGLAPGGVCRVSLRRPTEAGRRHRHCGTGPRLAADGRYPPPCAGELGLSSRRSGSPRPTRDHPTASLTPRCYRTRRRDPRDGRATAPW